MKFWQATGPVRSAAKWLALTVPVVGLLSTSALAAVRQEGSWPDADKPVTLSVQGLPRNQAVQKLADTMGWSLVLHGPNSDPVDLKVQAQPAGKVLDMLLSDRDYVAKRDGQLISIEPASAPAAPVQASPSASVSASTDDAPPAEPAPSVEVKEGPDRTIWGGSLRVEKGETVNDVTVFGGSVDIYGTVSGDLSAMGGSARVHPGAHIKGDASAIGGSLNIEDGAKVDGEINIMGGVIRRGDKAIIGSKEGKAKHPQTHLAFDLHDEDGPLGYFGPTSKTRFWSGLLHDVGSAITTGALFFVFGAVLLALGNRRMEILQAELAARPMRSFALGVVGVLAFIALEIALCVTVIGIPFAIAGALLAFLAACSGVCAVLTTGGGALLRHKTDNPYIHLALGCAIYLVVVAIPFLGGLAKAAIVLVGLGTIVATRAAGLIPQKNRPGSDHGPYRTSAPL